MTERPLLIVISAPSGAGKTVLCERLLADLDDIVYSISCTTRLARNSEVDGTDYFFLTDGEFDRRVADGDFLEYAEVHGYRYGTLKKMVKDVLLKRKSVLMDIDVQGARQIREHVKGTPAGDLLKDAFMDVFIEPPSMDELCSRLTERGEDSAEEIECRLRNAHEEMRHRDEYRHQIVNDDLDTALAELKTLIREEQKGTGTFCMKKRGGRK